MNNDNIQKDVSNYYNIASHIEKVFSQTAKINESTKFSKFLI